VISLPVGKGKHFLATIPAAADHVIGGWRLTTVSFLTSGSFSAPVMPVRILRTQILSVGSLIESVMGTCRAGSEPSPAV
jgi:hypothetical protein